MTRKVVCLNYDLEFDSLKEAAEWAGTRASCIYRVCCGDMKSTGRMDGMKLSWVYYSDYVNMTREEKNRRVHNAQLGKTHHTRKKIICLNTLEVFEGLPQARAWAVKSNNIDRCCRGEQETAGKHPTTGEHLKWMYYEDYMLYY